VASRHHGGGRGLPHHARPPRRGSGGGGRGVPYIPRHGCGGRILPHLDASTTGDLLRPWQGAKTASSNCQVCRARQAEPACTMRSRGLPGNDPSWRIPGAKHRVAFGYWELGSNAGRRRKRSDLHLGSAAGFANTPQQTDMRNVDLELDFSGTRGV
jgi:hypothetical protein